MQPWRSLEGATADERLSVALGAVALQGHRVLFASASDWVTRLSEAHAWGELAQELARLRRHPLLMIDEVGYLPFEPDTACLFFQLAPSRYEHASLILTSNPHISGWGTVFDDQAVAAAMIDRTVHHAEVLAVEGASCRLRGRGQESLLSAALTAEPEQGQCQTVVHFPAGRNDQFSSVSDRRRGKACFGIRRVAPNRQQAFGHCSDATASRQPQVEVQFQGGPESPVTSCCLPA